jgi:hypothetical protein
LRVSSLIFTSALGQEGTDAVMRRKAGSDASEVHIPRLASSQWTCQEDSITEGNNRFLSTRRELPFLERKTNGKRRALSPDLY